MRPYADAVLVKKNGQRISKHSLSEDNEYILNGGSNILVVKNGKAYMKEANCPDKLCIHQSKISRTGERIVCLPNRLMAYVIGEGDEIFMN